MMRVFKGKGKAAAPVSNELDMLDSDACAAAELSDICDVGTCDPADGLVHLAAFDFDGTCISGNSPTKLVVDLHRGGLLPTARVLRIIAWGLRYKYHLPHDEALVRGWVFSAFTEWPAEKVDAYLHEYYDRVLRRLVRPKAIACMEAHHAAGRKVIMVSATFKPILDRAQRDLPFDGCISVEMLKDGRGHYTCESLEPPTEGLQKVISLKRWADGEYGAGKWVLDYAYGDHYSDESLLRMAKHPCAVTPGPTLRKIAHECDFTVLDWSFELS